jgi:urease accessory protein
MAADSHRKLLELQQFADSALPIGGAAHSFGLETLVDAGLLSSENLSDFLRDYLEEAGVLEACYCGASCELGRTGRDLEQWLDWNASFAARKLARESREASAAMGRRFLLLAASVTELELLSTALEIAWSRNTDVHLAPCFGLTAGALEVDPELAAAAYLHQFVTTLLSCCQRLLPLGQTTAQAILWDLKPDILSAARSGVSSSVSAVDSFAFLPELASAGHPSLRTRLFIS